METTKKLVTHDGSFHTDDVFACATLSMILDKEGQKFEVIRTRDEKIIKNADYVFDVGGIYDEKMNRFDHHQIGGAGKRACGNNMYIDYASIGLVWKKFGTVLTGSERAAEMIDRKLAAPIDALDNGQSLVENKCDISPYYIQDLFFSIRPTWKETDRDEDAAFLECVELAKKILSREIIQINDALLAEEIIIAAYKNAADKRIIILDKHYPWELVVSNFPETLFVIYQREADGLWAAKTVRKDQNSFVNRKNFPKIWAGLRDEDLQNVSGVRDAVFCHRGLFLVVAKSKEGAIKLAQNAVES